MHKMNCIGVDEGLKQQHTEWIKHIHHFIFDNS